ncbi:MAG: glycosyltransferase family 2 protein [Deltaproteobacteria bacterium]|nr:glycosyltransferase family 2 protein [Deltaproteobacteria bacterium]MCL5277424.1 glycosyltransferase family 2 protein [Deltaproteobacteria bacterium]
MKHTDDISLDIVIPVYNEGENIIDTLHEIREYVPIVETVFVVYDIEEDSTLQSLNGAHKDPFWENRLRPVKNIYGHGALNAIKTGFHLSTSDWILVVMGDLSDDLSIVPQMLDQAAVGADIVCGSRYMKGGKHTGGPVLKNALSRLAGLSMHYLAGIPTMDVTNSFKLYSRKVIEAIPAESTGGFEIGMELVVKAYFKGHRIAEVPSAWKGRTTGKSRFDMKKWIPKYLKWYLSALKWKYVRNVYEK